MDNRFEDFQKSLMMYPDSGWRRFIFKAPLQLWRLGLGPLLGQYLLVLTHKGRNSGRIYHTMIEFHKLNGNFYVPVAFGPQTDWYRNIVANPLATIQTAEGSKSVSAVRVADDQELLDVYNYFLRRDPPLTKLYLKTLNIDANEEDVLANKEKIYWLRLQPVEEPVLFPLEVDLAWVWPALFGLLLALILIGRSKK